MSQSLVSSNSQNTMLQSTLYTPKYAHSFPLNQASSVPYADYPYNHQVWQTPVSTQPLTHHQSQRVASPTNSSASVHSLHHNTHSPNSALDNHVNRESYSSAATTPPSAQNSFYNVQKHCLNNTDRTEFQITSECGDHQTETNSIGASSRTVDATSTTYVPADSSVDISQFTEEDVIILKNLLPLSEVHKWKHVSNKVSKIRSKKMSAEYCLRKFHKMYNLPVNPKNTLLNTNYLMKRDGRTQKEKNPEGILGSSIPYIVSKDGWNSIDP